MLVKSSTCVVSQGIHLVTPFYQVFKTTLLSSESCDISRISLSFHKLPASSAIPTPFHSAINAILSIFLNICRFFFSAGGLLTAVLVRAAQSCFVTAPPPKRALTDWDELKYLCLFKGEPGLPLIILIVPAALNPQNSCICIYPLVPHEGTPGELKALSQKHTDAVCCFANPSELCMFRAA